MLDPMNEEMKLYRAAVSKSDSKEDLQQTLEALSSARVARGEPDLANLPQLLPELWYKLAPLREKAPPDLN